MRKRRVYLVVVAVAVLVGLFLWASRPEREPEYGGKRLSEWVIELPSNSSPDGYSDAEIAIHHIGTNALPYLMKWIRYEPGLLRLKLYEIAARFYTKAPNGLFQDKRMLRAAGAAQAFGALGPEAHVVMEELIRMMEDPKRRLSRVYATFAVASQQKGMGNMIVRNMSITVYSGGDALSLTYETNGVPILTLAAKGSNSPTAGPFLPGGRRMQGRAMLLNTN